jgi:phospholipid:diacylglycerol acyltransferase
MAAGLFVISPWKLPTLPTHLQLLLEHDFSLSDFTLMDWSGASAEWNRFKSSIPEPWKFINDGREFMVGEEMKARGLQAEFPVVLIPGIISTVSRPTVLSLPLSS